VRRGDPLRPVPRIRGIPLDLGAAHRPPPAPTAQASASSPIKEQTQKAGYSLAARRAPSRTVGLRIRAKGEQCGAGHVDYPSAPVAGRRCLRIGRDSYVLEQARRALRARVVRSRDWRASGRRKEMSGAKGES
jgi:hypothetical protein